MNDTTITETGIVLEWGPNQRDGKEHTEWHAPCGCAFHPKPAPHWHPCTTHATSAAALDEATKLANFWKSAYFEVFHERAPTISEAAKETK